MSLSLLLIFWVKAACNRDVIAPKAKVPEIFVISDGL